MSSQPSKKTVELLLILMENTSLPVLLAKIEEENKQKEDQGGRYE